MFGGIFGGFNGNQTFEAHYRCFPVSFLERADAEAGDKVFLPPSALDRLTTLHIEYPMLFRVENRNTGKETHCGVLEFIAEEGHVYMPYWMMQNMLVTEGELVHFRNVTLPKGTFVKLQPHTKDFLDISNPRAVLERTLRGYTCLTVGDAICLHYNGKKYYIDIIEAKPRNAISVVETDCEVDFAPPLDYVEPVNEPMGPPPPTAVQQGPSNREPVAGTAQAPAEEPTFAAFKGSGFRVDGKPVSATALPSRPPSSASGTSLASSAGGARGEAGAANGAPQRPAGKVMFGGGSGNRLLDKQKQNQAAGTPQKPPVPSEDAEKKDEKRFQAFTGKSFKLT